MLKPEDIEAIANDITDIYKDVESECVKAIAQHIASGKRVTQASVWQMHKLNEVGLLRKNLLVKVKQNAKNVTLPQVEQLVNEALNRSMLNDVNAIGRGLNKYATVSEALEQLKNSQQFQHIVKSAIAGCKDVINLTGTKAVQASVKAYTDAINTAYLEMTTGNYTFEDAVKRAVGRIGESGIKIVDSKDKATGNELVKLSGEKYTTYKAGNSVRIYPLDSAIRRDITTAINRSCGRLTLETCDELGSELVETSWHVGARPEHEVWQGRIFSLNPKDTRYPYFYAPQEAGGTGYGDMLGLCGINCYHSFSPYFEGAERATQDNKPTAEENAQAYKEQQTQRAYERNLRALKREQIAYKEAGMVAEAQDAQRRINDVSSRYKNFLKDTGRTRVSMLDKVSGYKRISVNPITTAPAKTPTFKTFGENVSNAYGKEIADKNLEIMKNVYNTTKDEDIKVLSEMFSKNAGRCSFYVDPNGNTACYSPYNDRVELNRNYINGGAYAERTLKGKVLSHEVGHYISAHTEMDGTFKAGRRWEMYSWNYENHKLWDALKKDYKAGLKAYPEGALFDASGFAIGVYKKFKEAQNAGNFTQMEAYLSVLDTIMGSSGGKDYVFRTHTISYFKGTDGHANSCDEFFAEVMESVSLGDECAQIIKQYFPTAYSVVVEMVKKMAW